MIVNLIKYDPFRELRGLHDEMSRLFTGDAGSSREEMMRGAWNPSVDVFEDKENLVIEAELPGVKKEDFDVSVENNVLTLRGERRFEKKDEGDNYHRVERSYGSFTRSFTLPQNVSGEGAQADFEDGVLRITLPKREETKARKIVVRGRSAETPAIEAEDKGKTASA